jgi:hypothetical protein
VPNGEWLALSHQWLHLLRCEFFVPDRDCLIQCLLDVLLAGDAGFHRLHQIAAQFIVVGDAGHVQGVRMRHRHRACRDGFLRRASAGGTVVKNGSLAACAIAGYTLACLAKASWLASLVR